jgi:hypothetical protein
MKMTVMMIIFCPFPGNGAPVEWNWRGKTEVLREKPVPVPLCQPQILHGTDLGSNPGLRGGRSAAMARPKLPVYSPVEASVFFQAFSLLYFLKRTKNRLMGSPYCACVFVCVALELLNQFNGFYETCYAAGDSRTARVLFRTSGITVWRT